MIVPSPPEGASVAGSSGVNGVLVTRDSLDGDWRGPAFYTIGDTSFGQQMGGQSSEIILLAMTDRGVASFLGNSFGLGVDVGIAAGPVGMGASAATANISADIVSFSRSKGLQGVNSLVGAMVAVREDYNKAYFKDNPSPTPTGILTTHDSRIQSSLAGSVARVANTWETQSQCKTLARAEKPDILATLRK
jgi:SH3 domain-containing YSC84-like protein 1